MFGLGAGELFLIFVIALLFLGPKKLPELAKGIGQAVREFQKSRDDMMAEINKPHPANADAAKKADVEVTPSTVVTTEVSTDKPESPKQS